MVDVNEFCRLLRVERSPFVERLFSMFDTDRGGLIDLKEFIVGEQRCTRASACALSLGKHLRPQPGCVPRPPAGLANVSGDVREDKVRFAFEVFDLDNSGFIEAHELRKIVRATNMASEKQLDRKVRWLLSQCDRNGDGQIRRACGRCRMMRITVPCNPSRLSCVVHWLTKLPVGACTHTASTSLRASPSASQT